MSYQRPRWIYWNQVFPSRFQAGCMKAKIEDNWMNGYETGPLVEIRKLNDRKYVVRYTFDETI